MIHEQAGGLGQSTVQETEPMAVHKSLRWMMDEHKGQQAPIHIFTDSQYAADAVTSHEPKSKHFYLVQEIHHLSQRLQRADIMTTIHWMPSHIENTLAGQQFTGNHFADKLANQGRMNATAEDENKRISYVREQLLSAVLQLVSNIDKKLELLDDPPDGPSAHADDFGARANADRDPANGSPDT